MCALLRLHSWGVAVEISGEGGKKKKKSVVHHGELPRDARCRSAEACRSSRQAGEVVPCPSDGRGYSVPSVQLADTSHSRELGGSKGKPSDPEPCR